MLRLIHAWNALLVVLLVMTAVAAEQLDFVWEAAALRRLHLWLGYGLVLGLVARILWGLVGPASARWRALWHPREWLGALRRWRLFTAPTAFGHHPLASGVYLLVYLLLAMAAVTGLALAAIEQGRGPLYEALGYHMACKPWAMTPHGWLDEIMPIFIVAHLTALVLHEKRHGLPMAQSMVSGYQYLEEKE